MPSFAQKNTVSSLKKQLSTVSSDTVRIDISIQLSESFASINADSCVFYYEKAFQLADQIDDIKRLQKAQTSIIKFFRHKGEYTKAKIYIDKGLEVAYNRNNDFLICNSLISLANWNRDLSNLKQTSEYLTEALKYSKKTNDLYLKGLIINSFALLYGELNEKEKEKDFTIQYYEISKKTKNTYAQAIALNNLGYFYMQRKNYSKVLQYVEQGILLAATIDENSMLYDFLNLMKGKALIRLGQKELGFSILESTLEKAIENKHVRSIVIINKYKAEFLFELKKYEDAIDAAKIGVNTSKETSYIKELPELCTILAKSYKAKKDFQSSLVWMEEQKKVEQEIRERKKDKEILQLEVNLELQKKETENQILLQKNKNQRIFIALIFTLGLICVLLIGYFFWKKNQKRLEYFQQRIAADLHDEVGSNLNNITRIAKGLKSKNINPNISQGIDQLVKKSNTTILNVVDVIWALDEEESKLEDLIEKMEAYLDGIKMTSKNIDVQFIKKNISGKTPLLINTKHHLLMAFKEAINNIQKHTHPTLITVELDNTNQKLKMNITNHFSSKKDASNSTGKGIINIRRRIHELGGTVEIKDVQDHFFVNIELEKIS